MKCILLLLLIILTAFQTTSAERRFITTLFCRDNGELWTGATDGLEVHTQEGDNVRYKIVSPYGATDHAITAIGTDREGAVWITTHNYAYCLDASLDSIVPARESDYARAGLPTGCRVFIDLDGHVTGTAGETVYLPETVECGDSAIYVTTGAVWLASGKILLPGDGRSLDAGIFPTAGAARIFITRDRGEMWVYDSFSPQCRRFSLETLQPLPVPEALNAEIVKCVAQTGDNRVAIATNHAGLLIIDPVTGVSTPILRNQGDNSELPSNHVTSLWDDGKSNKLWIGTSEGLTSIPSIATTTRLTDTGIGENISCFAVDGSGRLWIAFDGAGLALSSPDGTVSRRFTVKEGLPSNAVTFLDLLDGNIVGATYGGGMFVIRKDNSITPFPCAGKETPVARSRQFVRDRTGALWISSFSAGIGRLKEDSLKMFGTSNSALKTDYVTGLAMSPDSMTVYVASGYGIYAFDCASMSSRELPTGDDIPVAATCIATDNDGNVWFGTTAGVRIIDNGTVLLPGCEIVALAPGYNGVYAATVNGVYSLSVTAGHPMCHSLVPPEDFPERLRIAKYSLAVTPDGLYAGGFGEYLRVTLPGTPVIEKASQRYGWILTIAVIMLVGLLIFATVKLLRRRKPDSTVHPAVIKQDDDTPAVTNPDHEFLAKIDAVIARHIGDTDFSVEDFGNETGMSRSNLYKKVMAVTGKSPTEYLRDTRLTQGHRLLQAASESSVGTSVAEIAYSIGMSPRQFSRFYREKYGCLPSATMKIKN